MSKKAKVDSGKSYKIFAVLCHGLELARMEERLIKQMGFGSNKKNFVVTVNVPVIDPSGGSKWEATKLVKPADQIEDGLRKCKKEVDEVWPTLRTTLTEDAKRYWSGEAQPIPSKYNGNPLVDKVESFDEFYRILPNKIKKPDLQVFNAELDDKIKLPDYYVVIFGKLDNETLLNLLANKLPLQAVIHFIPCPESELNVNFPEVQESIDSLRNTPDSKNIGIFVESLDIEKVIAGNELTIQERQKFVVKMNEHFTNYLFDIEMLAQQFIVYQRDFVEVSQEPEPHPKQQASSSTSTYTSLGEEHDEGTVVGIFLDDLFSTVESNDDLHRTTSSASVCCLSPFLENNYGKIIVEEANKLLQSAVVSKLNLGTYWRLVNMLTSGTNISYGEVNVELAIELPRFYELLSWVSFVQRFAANTSHYDSCHHIDLDDLFSVLILRRLFNDIVRMQKKFRLSTKLDFRDFSYYIVPDLADIIRNIDKSLGIPRFVGVDIDGILKELTNSEEVFRFAEGSIRSCIDSWPGSVKAQPITVKMQLLGTDVFLYHSISPKLRIITQQNLMFNINLRDDDLAIIWPNGCRIRYLSSDGVKVIEQCYENKFEIKRFYTKEGLIIRFLRDERVEVLTPYGVVYMLYFGDAFSSEFNFENASQVDQSQVLDCIRFVRSLGKYGIYSDHFEVTQTDGWRTKVSNNGNILDEVANFLIYEWTDYREGKKYLDRDDGVKMVWSKDSLTCYYPCGNRITTTVVEDCFRTNFGCSTNLMDNIFGNTNPSFVAKGSNQAKLQDCYTTYHLNYSMQHKNFATVEVWGKDKIEIHCPDDFKLILKEETNYNDDSSHPVNLDVLIDIGKELSFHIAAGMCTVVTGASIRRRDKKFKVEMNWNPDVEDILSFNNQYFALKMDTSGNMQLSANATSAKSYSETLYMIAKEDTFAIEFITSKKYSQFVTSHANNKYFYNSKSQTVLLKPLFPINKTFSMPVSSKVEMELANFKSAACRPSKKPSTEDLVFTARVFNKLTRCLTGLNLNNFLGKKKYDECTLANQLDEALLCFFDDSIKGRNPKWENKINAHIQDMENKRKRAKFYHKLLQTMEYPKYFAFKDCNSDIKNVEFDEDDDCL